MNIVEAAGLAARYGRWKSLAASASMLRGGNFLALVGPNGSGKTTLVKSLLGLLPTSRGSIRLLGQTAPEFAQWHRIGYVPQATGNHCRRFPATVREIVAAGRLSLKHFPKRLTAEDGGAAEFRPSTAMTAHFAPSVTRPPGRRLPQGGA